MEPAKNIEYKVGVFVAIATLLTLAFIIALGGDKALLHRSFTLKVKTTETGGLSTGSVVQLSGIPCGNVLSIALDETNSVVVNLKIDRKYLGRLTKGSTVTLQTQGALGDKFVLIHPGPQKNPPLEDGEFVEVDTTGDLFSTLGRSGNRVEKMFDILDQMDAIMVGLNQKNFAGNLAETSRNLKESTHALQEILYSVKGSDGKLSPVRKSLDHLASILEKIDAGQGSLGGLINDPTVHDDLKTILGGAKRSSILKYLIRQTIKNKESEDSASH